MVAEAGKGKLTCSLFLARDLHCEKQSTKHHPSSEPTSFGYSHPSLLDLLLLQSLYYDVRSAVSVP